MAPDPGADEAQGGEPDKARNAEGAGADDWSYGFNEELMVATRTRAGVTEVSQPLVAHSDPPLAKFDDGTNCVLDVTTQQLVKKRSQKKNMWQMMSPTTKHMLQMRQRVGKDQPPQMALYEQGSQSLQLNIGCFGGDFEKGMRVPDDHADVMHTAISTVALAVCSPTPKLSPLTVTDPCPLCGVFSCMSDATAASKLSTLTPVPATAPTVT